jgi:hypothetical protein
MEKMKMDKDGYMTFDELIESQEKKSERRLKSEEKHFSKSKDYLKELHIPHMERDRPSAEQYIEEAVRDERREHEIKKHPVKRAMLGLGKVLVVGVPKVGKVVGGELRNIGKAHELHEQRQEKIFHNTERQMMFNPNNNVGFTIRSPEEHNVKKRRSDTFKPLF